MFLAIFSHCLKLMSLKTTYQYHNSSISLSKFLWRRGKDTDTIPRIMSLRENDEGVISLTLPSVWLQQAAAGAGNPALPSIALPTSWNLQST